MTSTGRTQSECACVCALVIWNNLSKLKTRREKQKKSHTHTFCGDISVYCNILRDTRRLWIIFLFFSLIFLVHLWFEFIQNWVHFIFCRGQSPSLIPPITPHRVESRKIKEKKKKKRVEMTDISGPLAHQLPLHNHRGGLVQPSLVMNPHLDMGCHVNDSRISKCSNSNTLRVLISIPCEFLVKGHGSIVYEFNRNKLQIDTIPVWVRVSGTFQSPLRMATLIHNRFVVSFVYHSSKATLYRSSHTRPDTHIDRAYLFGQKFKMVFNFTWLCVCECLTSMNARGWETFSPNELLHGNCGPRLSQCYRYRAWNYFDGARSKCQKLWFIFHEATYDFGKNVYSFRYFGSRSFDLSPNSAVQLVSKFQLIEFDCPNGMRAIRFRFSVSTPIQVYQQQVIIYFYAGECVCSKFTFEIDHWTVRCVRLQWHAADMRSCRSVV